MHFLMHSHRHMMSFSYFLLLIHAIWAGASTANILRREINDYPLESRSPINMAATIQSFVKSLGLSSSAAQSLTTNLEAVPDYIAFLNGQNYSAVSLSCVAATTLLEKNTVNLPPLNTSNVDINWSVITNM